MGVDLAKVAILPGFDDEHIWKQRALICVDRKTSCGWCPDPLISSQVRHGGPKRSYLDGFRRRSRQHFGVSVAENGWRKETHPGLEALSGSSAWCPTFPAALAPLWDGVARWWNRDRGRQQVARWSAAAAASLSFHQVGSKVSGCPRQLQ